MATTVWFLVCQQPANAAGNTLAQQCPTAERVQVQTTTEVLAGMQQEQEPFDYAQAAAAWSLAFTFVVGLWLVAKNAGLILSFIRRG